MTKPKEKISDQLAGGRFVFLEPKSRSEVPTFGDMFPAVADLDIVIEENGSLPSWQDVQLSLVVRTFCDFVRLAIVMSCCEQPEEAIVQE